MLAQTLIQQKSFEKEFCTKIALKKVCVKKKLNYPSSKMSDIDPKKLKLIDGKSQMKQSLPFVVHVCITSAMYS